MSPWNMLFLFVALFLPTLSFAQTSSSTLSSPSPAATADSTVASTASPVATASSAASGSASGSRSSSISRSATRTVATPTSPGGVATTSTPPDVLLRVPNLSVGRIELIVEELKADINLAAKVAGLVSINAGVAVSVEKINVTIADVSAQLELDVRLGHLADIVHRVFDSLDLNPLIIGALNNVTSLVNTVVGAVDGLLGSITQGGTTLSFLIDNLGNIVQQVAGEGGKLVSTVVGDYLTNMTFTGASQQLGNGLTQKTYSYSPLNSLINIIFNTLGQVVQATVVKKPGTTSSPVSSVPTATSAAAASTTPTASTTPAARL